MKVAQVCKVCGKEVVVEIPDDAEQLDMSRSSASHSQRRKDGLPFDPPVNMAQLFKTHLVPLACHNACAEALDRRWQAQENAKKIIMRAQLWAGICPALYQDTDPTKIPDKTALARVDLWTWGERGLVLHGPTGKGKTRMVFLILLREFQELRTIARFTHAEFAAKVIQLMDGRRSLPDWTATLTRVDILFIDDFGKSRFTDYAERGKHSEEVLFSIFEGRIANRLPTLFTTNMTEDELKAAMSPDRAEPFLRRMREFCDYVRVDKGRSAGEKKPE